jgi:transcriptional regulator with GAF, ATPase, and Fis domain
LIGLNNQPIDISTGGFMTALLTRIAPEFIQALNDALFIVSGEEGILDINTRSGRFRNDLYHRLAVFSIHLPPLRERREDIPLLAACLVTRKAHQLGRRIDKISDTILERLNDYDWPGNVRELENVLERSIILSSGTSLRLDAIHLGSTFPVKDYEPHILTNVKPSSWNGDSLQVHERKYILSICRETNWRIKGTNGAAKRLGLNPGTLYSRMKKLGIKRPKAL